MAPSEPTQSTGSRRKTGATTYGRSPLQTRRAWTQAIDALLSGGRQA